MKHNILVTGGTGKTGHRVVEGLSHLGHHVTIGRNIQYIPISIEAFKEGMKAAGLPDSYVWLFGYLFKEVLGNPDNQEVSDDVAKVLGRPAKDFETYAKQTATSGVWNQVSVK